MESVRYTKLRVLAARSEGRRWSVSRDIAWDVVADPFCTNFCDTEQEVTCDQKKIIQKWVRLPRPRQDLETDHLRPSNLAVRTLSLAEHTISQVWWRPVSCEAMTCGSGEVLCAKSTFFPLLLRTEREKPESCVGFNTTKE